MEQKRTTYIVWEDEYIKEKLETAGYNCLNTVKSNKYKNSVGYVFKSSRDFFKVLDMIKEEKDVEAKQVKFEKMISDFNELSKENREMIIKQQARKLNCKIR